MIRWFLSGLLALHVLLGATGCATGGAGRPYTTFRDGRNPSSHSEVRGGFGFWKKADDFQLLQQAAGLEEDSFHALGEELEPSDARALWAISERAGLTLQNFAPRRSLLFLLRQVLSQGEDIAYSQVVDRLRPFRFLVVMRPDGYLARALDGKPLQRMGRVELREGRFMAGAFEVGAFYRDRGGVFYTVDDSLRQPGVMVGELGLERDWLNAAFDGAEDALEEMALALGHFITSPVQSIQGLRQLPSAVAALIASSPRYFARYATLPLQEQIREAARLSTHLLMLCGGAAGTTARVGTAGTRLPVLSLSAEGTLAMEQMVVPMGATVAALGTGAGAVYVLMGAGNAPEVGKEAARHFKSFTEANFRENLARLTGQMPEGAHAHHVFPLQFTRQFRDAGIQINDPRFGAWWERSQHLKNSAAYNERWRRFLDEKPGPEQILQFGRKLGGEFGFQVSF
ncbi:MAG TPA: hypothetical protein VK539_16810 [Myxococcaceae bacterium]|nr:hypothetical protein [Myxococcaceae bacterium]